VPTTVALPPTYILSYTAKIQILLVSRSTRRAFWSTL